MSNTPYGHFHKASLYLKAVAQNGWFPDIVKVKKKRQFVLTVLTVRMQNLICGVCLPFC